MSAILGLVFWDGHNVNPHHLEAAMDAASHYGGDGHGIWTYRNVGLGHQTLYITSESSGIQQLPALDNLTITADARIDNRTELFQRLAIPIDERTKMSDSQLILTAYVAWGEDCVQYLLGDFAFAIWDDSNRHLFCARDFIGARPFYYYQTDKLFAFASDLKVLFTFDEVVVAIDEEQVLHSLTRNGPQYNYDPSRTSYYNTYRLPFAHQMTISAEQTKLRQHWHPPDTETLSLSTEEQYIENMQGLLDEAIRSRIRTEFTVGSHLSGGLDSSSVSVIAARKLAEQGRTMPVYSWSPPAGRSPDNDSEQFRIEAICRQENLTCRYIPRIPQPQDLRTFIPSQQVPAEHGVMQRAKVDQVRVMLSGWGGDEFITYNGRGIRADLFTKGRWLSLLRTFRWRPFHPARIRDFFLGLWRGVGLVFLPDAVYRRWHPGLNVEIIDWDDVCLSPDFVERLHRADRATSLRRYEVRGRYNNQKNLFYNGHLTDRMEHWAADGAQYGLVYTYPLLDRRIVEFAFSVPDSFHLRSGMARYVFYHATRSLFPADCLPEILYKGEPGKQSHQHILYDFMIARRNPEEDIERLIEGIPGVELHCLRDILLKRTTYEDRKNLRAWEYVRLWHALKAMET